ncbi:MAG: cysteine desulfurase [Candidatus Nanohaloarchaeota archaeon QJJ-7]|nr:cysteine desulfurase [Candidatus Nanohaloarchaeota archaeon QJJ-7]
MRKQDFSVAEEVTYLDSACMSLRPEKVIERIEEYYREFPACPGRSVHSLSRRAEESIEETRGKVADLIGASPDNIVLTSGTTEGINLVSHSLDFSKSVISDREHNSNLVPWQRRGEVEVIGTEDGFDLEQLDETVEEGDLVSVVHVSNLDGWELPVEEIVKVAKENGAYTLVDAAQSIPHQPFSVGEVGADLVAFSGHKMLGPSGTGALYASDRVKDEIEPFITGGEAVSNTTYESAEFQEFPHRMEAGLPNVAGIAGLGAAVDYLQEVGMERIEEHEEELTARMREGLEQVDGVEPVGKEGSGIESFRLENVEPHQAAMMLDDRDIAVRSGMHCVHSWFNSREKGSSVRASLYLYNDEEDVNKFLDAVEKLAVL